MLNRMLMTITASFYTSFSIAEALPHHSKNDSVMVVNAKSLPEIDKVHINSEELNILHGTSNADVFLTIPGLQVNNSRNEAGALDIGIRGIQDEGRVNIVIDNSLQSALTDRGYQGKSDRTYIDMDLIRDINITKGSSLDKFSGGALGGVIQMRTLDALDIIPTGKNFGLYLKGSIYNNNRKPHIPDDSNDRLHYAISKSIKQSHFNNGAYTTAIAWKDDFIDGILAFSERQIGNYFAGNRHFKDQSEVVVPQRGEVPNTSFESHSGLMKINIHPNTASNLELNFRRHLQQAGEVRSAYWFANYLDKDDDKIAIPQWQTGTARVNTYSANYTYNPIDSNWLDLSVGMWMTQAKMKQTNGMANLSNKINDEQYIESYQSNKRGVNIANSSYINSLDSSLTYGVTYQKDQSIPNNTTYIGDDAYKKLVASSRHGERIYTTGYLNFNYDGDFFSFLVGSRMQYARVKDLAYAQDYSYHSPPDFFSEVTFKISQQMNFYSRYNNTYRLPNMYESTRSMMSASRFGDQLNPENGQYYTVGVRGKFSNIFPDSDALSYDISYFNNKIKNFISTDYNHNRKNWYDTVFEFKNYRKYITTGFELSIDYDSTYLFGKVSGTLYDDINVCDVRSKSYWDIKSEKYLLTRNYECSSNGFGFSTLPARIPTRKQAAIILGVKLLNDDLKLGTVIKYHSAKKNPDNMSYGAANNIMGITSGRTIDLFSQYQVNKNATVFFKIDNITNEYQYDPGTIVSMPVPGRTMRASVELTF